MALDDVKRPLLRERRKHVATQPQTPELAARLSDAMGTRSRAEVAREAEISWPLLDAYLKGSRPGADKLARLASVLNVRLEWLTTGKGLMRASGPLDAAFLDRDQVQVPLYPVELSAGPGRTIWPGGEPVGHYSVPLQSVRGAHLSIAALVGFNVRGNSMEPGIRDGDVAIIDASRTLLPPAGKGIYAIRQDDALNLKHLAWDGEQLVLSSENVAEYPPQRLAPADAERLQIIGRLWVTFHRQPAMMQD